MRKEVKAAAAVDVEGSGTGPVGVLLSPEVVSLAAEADDSLALASGGTTGATGASREMASDVTVESEDEDMVVVEEEADGWESRVCWAVTARSVIRWESVSTVMVVSSRTTLTNSERSRLVTSTKTSP